MKKNPIFTQKDQPASQKIEVLRKKMTSQFRGIAEVVKEFMEYIANEMMAAHKKAVVIANIRQN